MHSVMAADKYDVFISYSRADYKDDNNEPIPNNVISKITSAFKKKSISYWIDEDGIYTGDNFAPKIAEAIKDSSVFVFVSTIFSITLPLVCVDFSDFCEEKLNIIAQFVIIRTINMHLSAIFIFIFIPCTVYLGFLRIYP